MMQILPPERSQQTSLAIADARTLKNAETYDVRCEV
jgi:hypothetical protein